MFFKKCVIVLMLLLLTGTSYASYYDLSRNAIELKLSSEEKDKITSLYNNMQSRMKNRQFSTIAKTMFFIPRENVKEKAIKVLSKSLQEDVKVWENAKLVEIRKYTVSGNPPEENNYLILLKITNKPDFIKYVGPDINENSKNYKFAPIQILIVKVNSKYLIHHYDLWLDYPSVKMVPDYNDLYDRPLCD